MSKHDFDLQHSAKARFGRKHDLVVSDNNDISGVCRDDTDTKIAFTPALDRSYASSRSIKNERDKCAPLTSTGHVVDESTHTYHTDSSASRAIKTDARPTETESFLEQTAVGHRAELTRTAESHALYDSEIENPVAEIESISPTPISVKSEAESHIPLLMTQNMELVAKHCSNCLDIAILKEELESLRLKSDRLDKR
jgi:hypothetical protein